MLWWDRWDGEARRLLSIPMMEVAGQALQKNDENDYETDKVVHGDVCRSDVVTSGDAWTCSEIFIFWWGAASGSGTTGRKAIRSRWLKRRRCAGSTSTTRSIWIVDVRARRVEERVRCETHVETSIGQTNMSWDDTTRGTRRSVCQV